MSTEAFTVHVMAVCSLDILKDMLGFYVNNETDQTVRMLTIN